MRWRLMSFEVYYYEQLPQDENIFLMAMTSLVFCCHVQIIDVYFKRKKILQQISFGNFIQRTNFAFCSSISFFAYIKC